MKKIAKARVDMRWDPEIKAQVAAVAKSLGLDFTGVGFSNKKPPGN